MNLSNKHTANISNTWLLSSIAILAICLLILAYVPPISRDALIHHLQIPKLYLLHGGIYEIPDLIFSYYPMNLDLLYMGALHLGNDILPKYIHMLFALGTAFLIYHYLNKRLSKTYALLGTLFFLSIPIIVKLSITVYVDLGLIFFSTAALLSLLHWIENKKNRNYLILAGICCGLAMGTKYNGLLILFLLTLFTPILVIRSSNRTSKPSRQALQAGMLFFVFAILTTSPWLIRNSLWTGNPVYPLYESIFNPAPTANITTDSSDSIGVRGVFATRHVLYGESIGQLLLLPARIFFEGKDNDPRYFDGRLNPFLLLLPFFAFLRSPTTNKQVRLEKKTLIAFCILYFLFAFNTGVLRIRYLAPMIPFLVILSMYGLHNIASLARKHLPSRYTAHIITLLLVAIMLSGNVTYIYQQFKSINPASYISGRLSRDAYISKYRPEYKVMKYANTHLSDATKILCVFMGWRGYYLNKQHVFDHHSNPDLLLSWLNEPDITINAVLKRLRDNDLSHIMLREDLAVQWVQHLSLSQQRVWATLMQKHLSVLTSYTGYTLYQILPSMKENATVRKARAADRITFYCLPISQLLLTRVTTANTVSHRGHKD